TYQPLDEDLASIGINPGEFRQGRARRVKFKNEVPPPPGMLYRAREGVCPPCLSAGYKGRTAIYELLMVDETVRQLAIKNADAGTIKRAATSKGRRTRRDAGAQRVLAGMTSAAEVLMMTTEDTE